MNKLWLIIQREYLSRVKKRSFILATLITPLAIGAFMVLATIIFDYESDDKRRVAIIDESNLLDGVISDNKNLYFHFEDQGLEELRSDFESKDYDAILLIPKLTDLNKKQHTIYFYSDQQVGLDVRMSIENKIGKSIRDYKILSLGLDKEKLETLNTKVTLNPEPIDPTQKDESSLAAIIAVFLGGAMGFFMYITIFIYGMMVMRSVMEEKTNRIVEVMISSVKPFQLMMGKLIGVGAVGLTQVAIWAIMIPLISIIVQFVFGFDGGSQLEMSGALDVDSAEMNQMSSQFFTELKAQNWLMIFPLFIIYFLGGYFVYASLFAAVGSAIGDDLGEGQALTIPITIPVIIAFYIMTVAVRAPQSSLAVWASIFPLFSPIVMPARLAFNPPFWQIALSIVVLIATSIFFIWLCARIYRVGILMYGKKVSLRELGKWLFYKE